MPDADSIVAVLRIAAEKLERLHWGEDVLRGEAEPLRLKKGLGGVEGVVADDANPYLPRRDEPRLEQGERREGHTQ